MYHLYIYRSKFGPSRIGIKHAFRFFKEMLTIIGIDFMFVPNL